MEEMLRTWLLWQRQRVLTSMSLLQYCLGEMQLLPSSVAPGVEVLNEGVPGVGGYPGSTDGDAEAASGRYCCITFQHASRGVPR